MIKSDITVFTLSVSISFQYMYSFTLPLVLLYCYHLQWNSILTTTIQVKYFFQSNFLPVLYINKFIASLINERQIVFLFPSFV